MHAQMCWTIWPFLKKSINLTAKPISGNPTFRPFKCAKIGCENICETIWMCEIAWGAHILHLFIFAFNLVMKIIFRLQKEQLSIQNMKSSWVVFFFISFFLLLNQSKTALYVICYSSYRMALVFFCVEFCIWQNFYFTLYLLWRYDNTRKIATCSNFWYYACGSISLCTSL